LIGAEAVAVRITDFRLSNPKMNNRNAKATLLLKQTGFAR
jgi:hypothetical protein